MDKVQDGLGGFGSGFVLNEAMGLGGCFGLTVMIKSVGWKLGVEWIRFKICLLCEVGFRIPFRIGVAGVDASGRGQGMGVR